MRKVNILGTEYTIHYGTKEEYPNLEENYGYCDITTKEIIVSTIQELQDENSRKDLEKFQRKVLRHEVLHCVLAESGLDGCGHTVEVWEYNEEMIDWFAIQFPKILAIYRELGIEE